MILILISLGLLLTGICTAVIYEKKGQCPDYIGYIGFVALIVGIGLSFIFGLICLIQHTGTAMDIKDAEIERKSLVNRYFIAAPIEMYDTERVSVSDVMKDIAEYNKKVEHYHYWQKNPWTSWLYSKKVSEALKTIHVETFGDGSDECPYQTAIVEEDAE